MSRAQTNNAVAPLAPTAHSRAHDQYQLGAVVPSAAGALAFPLQSAVTPSRGGRGNDNVMQLAAAASVAFQRIDQRMNETQAQTNLRIDRLESAAERTARGIETLIAQGAARQQAVEAPPSSRRRHRHRSYSSTESSPTRDARERHRRRRETQRRQNDMNNGSGGAGGGSVADGDGTDTAT